LLQIQASFDITRVDKQIYATNFPGKSKTWLSRPNLVQKNLSRIGLVVNWENVRTNYFKVLLTF
jgi:hypothetical protein